MKFLETVEQSGKWPQQSCTTMFFLTVKNVTSERPIALMPTLIRWWEALRAPDQQWRSGSRGIALIGTLLAQRTVWEVLMEMERVNGKAKGEDQGAVALVLDLAKAFERVSLPVVWAGRRISAFEGRSCGCCAVILSTRGVYSSNDVRQSRSQPSRLSCQGRSGAVCSYVLCCRMR